MPMSFICIFRTVCIFFNPVSKIQGWSRCRKLVGVGQPNQMRCHSLSCDRKSQSSVRPPQHFYASWPVLQWGSQWAAIHFFSSCLCSLILSSRMRVLLALPLQRLLPRHMMLQVLSAKVFRWDFSNGSVAVLTELEWACLMEEFPHWSQCPEFDYGCGFLCLFTFSEKFVNALPDAYAALIPIMQGEL